MKKEKTKQKNQPIPHTFKAELVAPSGEVRLVRVQVDNGSTITLVNRHIADALDIRGPRVTLLMENTCGKKQKCPNERSVSFRLRNVDGSYTTRSIPSYTVPQICSKIEPIRVTPSSHEHLKVKMTETLPHEKPQEIDVLLGEPDSTHILTGEIRRGKNDTACSLKAIGSKLGYWLAGEQPSRANQPRVKYTVLHTRVSPPVEEIQDFWKHENIGIEPPNDDEMTLDEKLSLEKMEQTAVYDPVKKYWTVDLLWIDKKIPYTGTTEAKAVARRMEQILKSDPAKAAQMNAAFKELKDSGFTAELPPEAEFEQGCYFVQIHGVFRDSVTTKLRLVLNCSSTHPPDKKSVNDFLLKGVLYLKDLTHLLLKWRLGKIAWTGDLSKFYLRIRLTEDAKRYHRFYWRNCDSSKPFKIYSYQRVCFGYKESPFKAMWVMKKTAEMFKDDFPEAHDVLQNDVYLDDVVSTSEDSVSCANVIKDIVTVLAKADLPMHKIIASDPSVTADLPEEMKAKDTKTKVLGVGWDSLKDTISVNVNLDEIAKPVLTKRGLLQQLARTFEPIGYLSAFLMTGKLLMAKTFQTPTPLGWDDPLPDDIRMPFLKFLAELKELKEFEVPRRCVSSDFVPSHLAVFSDASKVGISSVAYLCSKDAAGNVQASLVFAKSRVVDRSQKWTIPRLELAAALLGARVGKYVKEALNIKKCFYFSDSDCTLFWIRESPLSMRTWVANRLKELQLLTSPNDWWYCPSADNPSDLGSRSCSLAELRSSDIWWKGPPWLSSSTEKWRRTSQTKSEAQVKAETAAERKPETKAKILQTTVVKEDEEDVLTFDKFIKLHSSYSKTVKQVCIINRFFSWLCRKNVNHPYTWNFNDKIINAKEFRQGEDILFRRAQQESFQEEYKILKKNAEDDEDRQVARTSPLFKLNPYFDQRRQLIMIRSRLSDSDHFQDLVLLPYKTEEEDEGRMKLRRQKKIKLLKNHPLTQQLVRFTHLTNAHAPMATTHAILRHRVWILGGRKAITSFLFGCLCRDQVRITQQIAKLPPARLEAFSSFTKIAVDYFGHLLYYQENADGELVDPRKCWGLLFTCFTTRAIKLYLVKDLTTETFFDCFTKLECHNGRSNLIQSDNQSTFRKADKELKALLKKINWDALRKHDAAKGTDWNFTSDYCPSENGIVESLVSNCKRAIRAAVRNQKLTFEKLDVVFAEVEAVVNSRPIAYYESDDPNECRSISAFELLRGRPRDPLPDPQSYEGLSLASVWRIRRRILNNFWRLWSQRYLTDLQVSKKWPRRNQAPIAEGLRCLVKDKAMSRNNWKSAIVVAVHPSRDGLIRKVTLRTPNGSHIRRNVRDLSYYEDSLITQP